MKLKKIKVTLYFGLSLFLIFAVMPQSTAEEELNYELLLAESDTEEIVYEDYEDDEDEGEYADEAGVEENDDDQEEVVQNDEEEKVEKHVKSEPVEPIKVKKEEPKMEPNTEVKKSVVATEKSNYSKGKFRRLKRDCNMRSIASVSGRKVGVVKKRKKLWTETAGEKWIQVQRRSGPAYISQSCF